MRFQKLHLDAKAPYKKDPDDAGYDLHAVDDIIIPSLWERLESVFNNREYYNGQDQLIVTSDHEISFFRDFQDYATKVKTGIALEIPSGQYGKIFDRSGMGSKLILTSAGVIDSTYRGEILVAMYNLSFQDYRINKGDRIAQIVFHEYKNHEFEEGELSSTLRGETGFGASGR